MEPTPLSVLDFPHFRGHTEKFDIISSLEDAKEKVEEWRQDYNLNRPHSSLGNISPAEFAEQKHPLEQAMIRPPGTIENDLHFLKLT